jgi:hypothetical protein
MNAPRDLTAARWRKSSYSNAEGGECVEVAEGAWRKSSYSNDEGGECVEVADGFASVVPVRDSKNPHGPVLLIAPSAWTAFVDTLASR